jgi:predicted nucleic acid-binding protein
MRLRAMRATQAQAPMRAAGDISKPIGTLDDLPPPLPLAPGRRHLRSCWRACGPMSVKRATYLDSSAIVKLVVREPESAALSRYLRGRGPIVASALASVEVLRVSVSFGLPAQARAHDVLNRLDLIRINDRVLTIAGGLLPPELRSLDAIHLATASLLGDTLGKVVTYDARMAEVARGLGSWSKLTNRAGRSHESGGRA